MTTASCLSAPNRNDALTRHQLEKILLDRLGCEKMLWVEHGELTGDDTDGHIDTLARFAPGGIILYTGCDDTNDEHTKKAVLPVNAQLQCRVKKPDSVMCYQAFVIGIFRS